MQAIQLGPTPVDAAIDRAQLFLRESEGDRLLTASILSSLAVLLAMRGEFDEARAQWARARALWDELGMAHHRAIRAIDALDDRAAGRRRRGRRARAPDRVPACSRRSATCTSRPTIAAYLAAALAHEGRFAEAEELASLRGVPRLGGRHRHAGDVAGGARPGPGAAGDAAEAERLAREAVELAAPTDFLDLQATALLALARVLRAAGSPEAASAAAEAQAVYERKGNVVGAGWAARLA